MYLFNNIEVVILVGGRGTRLQSVVKDVPKPMAPIGDRPFLEYLIENFRRFGLKSYTLLAGYKADIVADHFAGDSNISMIKEEEPLGTGGAILNALGSVDRDYCLVVNGDTFFNGDPSLLIESYTRDVLGMGLTKVEDISRYGSISVNDNDFVLEMKEKDGAGGSGLINLGMYLFHKKLLEEFKSLGKCSMETDILPALIQKNAVLGKELQGEFIDIGIPEDYQRAQSLIPSWLEA